MPKSRSVTREDVLKAAAEVVRKRGETGLNVRAVAEELGCSTQPVYSLFASMEELKAALFEEAKAQYRRYIDVYLESACRSRYESYGMGFVRFAREERGLFRYLFLRSSEKSVFSIKDPYLPDIIEEMMTLYHMTEDKAMAFHTDMAVFSFGLGVLVNAGEPLTDEEVSKAFKREFFALYALYFPERPHFWEHKE